MRKNLVTLFFGFVFIAALVSNAQAQMCGCMGEKGGGMPEGMMGGMGHHDMGMMPGMGGMQGGAMMMEEDHPMWKHLMALGLDEKQKEALKALRSKTMKDMVKKKADKQIADIELRDLLDKDTVDMKAVEALAKKKESLKTEMFLAHVKAHEEMKSILTPEQRKKLKEMMGPGHGGGCGMMGGMKGGDAEHKDMPMHEHMH
jgi:Spy/CpxP family protein refolding chaperone